MTTKKQNIPLPPFEVGTRLRYNGKAEIDFNGALFCPGTTVTIERTHAGDMYISDDGIEVIRPGTSTYFLSGAKPDRFRPDGKVGRNIRPENEGEWLVVCPLCDEDIHTCAGCGEDYCDCTIAEWAVGKDGVTYCTKDCADANAS